MTLYVMRFTTDSLVKMGKLPAEESVHLGKLFVSFDPVHGPVTTTNVNEACRFVNFQQAIDTYSQVSNPSVAEFTTMGAWWHYDPESTDEKPEPWRPMASRYSMNIEEV